MATYSQIRNWVKEHHGWAPETCWIAHVKELNAFPVKRAWNRRGNRREKPCPESKRPVIEEAFRHFGMMR
jgi:hypothetical protein